MEAWNGVQVNEMGEMFVDPRIFSCESCNCPILIYGRMIPCKHFLCHPCALDKCKTRCSRCGDAVSRIERCELSQLFVCTHGGPKQSFKACRRTYLSRRDLEAHQKHRHAPKGPETPPPPVPGLEPTPLPLGPVRSNLITINLQQQ